MTVGSSGEFEINIATYQQFVRLLVNVGIGERAALSLASALVDWQDSNSRPEPGGAEDFTYSQLEIPYGAANAPIMDIDELRLVKGFTPELIDVLRLYSCVDPVSMETIINLNSVEPKDAVLLHALLGISNSIQSMEMVINERSANGYDNVARFWDHRFLKDEEINQNIRKQFTISPKRYSIVVDVKLDYTNVHMESLILINNDGTYSLIDRKLGA
ncbi:MAG: general secretion pathway protein GspK [Kordiimonadaceae bacterium]|nr:general secretion pathway protein GspK [Kordiimonadaceae bacterium]